MQQWTKPIYIYSNLMADDKHVGVSEGDVGYKEKLRFKSFICMYRWRLIVEIG